MRNHESHAEFTEALMRLMNVRKFMLSWQEDLPGDQWVYNIHFKGERIPVLMLNEYEYTEFECRDSIKEAFRRVGVKL